MNDINPKRCMEILLELQEDESVEGDFYPLADELFSILSFNENAPRLVHEMRSLSDDGKRVILGSMTDLESLSENKSIAFDISEHLYSSNERVAQAAASCLSTCFGQAGKEILSIILQLPSPPITHKDLVQGIQSFYK